MAPVAVATPAAPVAAAPAAAGPVAAGRVAAAVDAARKGGGVIYPSARINLIIIVRDGF